MEEKLIGGFMSGNMWTAGTPYYGFYLTTDRILGVKGFLEEISLKENGALS